jgi:DNA-binding NarL/FixJ family response regulator
MNRIKVLIAVHESSFRSSVCNRLVRFDDIEVVAEVTQGECMIQEAARLLPDVILIDLSLPQLDISTSTQCLKEQHPEVKLIALTQNENIDSFFSTLKAGFDNYLTNTVPIREFAEAIRSTYSAQPSSYHSAVMLLMEDYFRHKDKWDRNTLTKRENAVLELLAVNSTDLQIADALGISLGTARGHLQNIKIRLGLHSRVEIIDYAKHSLARVE